MYLLFGMKNFGQHFTLGKFIYLIVQNVWMRDHKSDMLETLDFGVSIFVRRRVYQTLSIRQLKNPFGGNFGFLFVHCTSGRDHESIETEENRKHGDQEIAKRILIWKVVKKPTSPPKHESHTPHEPGKSLSSSVRWVYVSAQHGTIT
jgi:hypothetical protein